jgi:uncharacterized YigZ family protein
MIHSVMSRYQVPKARTRVEIRISNSRFIATLDRASTMDDAQALLRGIRAEMPDASHHVYAFRIGHGASVSERLSDDGEPSGTSGPPAMAVVRGSGVGDVALVISRYFGGTKLGTGGLVSAYTAAAKAAFASLQTEEKVTRIACVCTVPYALLEPMRKRLSAHACLIDREEFGESVRISFRAADDLLAGLVATIRDLSAGAIQVHRV